MTFVILKDSWLFFRNNLRTLTLLCLPIILLEALYEVTHTSDPSWEWLLIVGQLSGPVLLYHVYARATGKAGNQAVVDNP